MSGIEKLLEIMASLRDPETGCPWDLEQDFSTIAPYTIEEAYEVVEAVQRGEPDTLREELGDLLLATVNLAPDPESGFDGFWGACSTYGSFSYLKYGMMRLYSQIAQDSEALRARLRGRNGAARSRAASEASRPASSTPAAR